MPEIKSDQPTTISAVANTLRENGVICLRVETAGKVLRFYTGLDLQQEFDPKGEHGTAFDFLITIKNLNLVTFYRTFDNSETQTWSFNPKKVRITSATLDRIKRPILRSPSLLSRIVTLDSDVRDVKN